MTIRTGHMGYTFRFFASGRCGCRGKRVRLWKNAFALSARLLDGEPMTDVCRDFGVSRKTGYKIFDRYKEHGLEALSDSLEAAGALCQPAARKARIDLIPATCVQGLKFGYAVFAALRRGFLFLPAHSRGRRTKRLSGPGDRI